MLRKMLIHITEDEPVIAFVENGELCEVYLPTSAEDGLVGSIYKGRVENVLPGMQAAFIDIGLERNAFLYVDDVVTPNNPYSAEPTEQSEQQRDISTLLKPGQELLVQVFKAPVDKKGARVTMHPSLPGRYLVLLPNGDYTAISRRIEDEAERERLRTWLQEILPTGGVIVRTTSATASQEELARDCQLLTQQWRRIQGKAAKSATPALIYREMDLLKKVIRDANTDDFDRIVVEDDDAAEKVRELIEQVSPGLSCPIEVSHCQDIFAKYNIYKQLEKALKSKVWLKSGGYIVFDQTEALTVVDVNTGKYVGNSNLDDTVLTTNLEAVAEIARQLRLRNIGGIIIIDFINMENMVDKQKVLDVLEVELKKDRTRITMLGMTNLGMVELTRRKLGHELSKSLEKECPFCHGKGLVLHEEVVARRLRQEILREANNTTAPQLMVRCNNAVAAALLGIHGRGLQELEQQTQKTIVLQGESGLRMEDFTVYGLPL